MKESIVLQQEEHAVSLTTETAALQEHNARLSQRVSELVVDRDLVNLESVEETEAEIRRLNKEINQIRNQVTTRRRGRKTNPEPNPDPNTRLKSPRRTTNQCRSISMRR